ncbi:MAG: DUF2393 family protein [Campylobacterota bacterium]|nr:DUF2393 family protein [Campylobacterota bacterium]
MTLLNYWHYIALIVIFILFIIGVFKSLQQEKNEILLGMIFSTTLVSIFLAVVSVVVIDKYTKDVALYKVKNKRLLSIEKVIYTGVVKNEGDFPIGKVTFEVKLVNKGHATGNVKGGNFYKPKGLFDIFSSDENDKENRAQSIVKEFVVAKNLQPGTSKSFRVYFAYPPYFRSVAHFTKVSGH